MTTTSPHTTRASSNTETVGPYGLTALLHVERGGFARLAIRHGAFLCRAVSLWTFLDLSESSWTYSDRPRVGYRMPCDQPTPYEFKFPSQGDDDEVWNHIKTFRVRLYTALTRDTAVHTNPLRVHRHAVPQPQKCPCVRGFARLHRVRRSRPKYVVAWSVALPGHSSIIVELISFRAAT